MTKVLTPIFLVVWAGPVAVLAQVDGSSAIDKLIQTSPLAGALALVVMGFLIFLDRQSKREDMRFKMLTEALNRNSETIASNQLAIERMNNFVESEAKIARAERDAAARALVKQSGNSN